MTARLYRIEVSTVSPAGRLHRIEVTAPSALKARLHRVEVTAPPTPSPDAGPDMKDLPAWGRIELHGTETSNVGASVAQRWVQVSGAAAEIINGNSADAYYWAPGSTDGESLEFGYQVQSSGGVWSPVDVVKHTFSPSVEFAAVGGRLVPMGIIQISSGFSLGTLTK